MARKKFFTPSQANAMLPLVGRIVRDITEQAHQMRTLLDRLDRLNVEPDGPNLLVAQEIQSIEDDVDKGRDRLDELVRELSGLGVLLKDYFTGLIDFPCWMDDHEVYLCWKLGEPEVAHWHEIEAGFSGRQKLMTAARVN